MITHSLSNFAKTFLRYRKKGQFSVLQEFSSESTNKPADMTFDFGASYTQEEKKTILEIVNTSTIEELKRYNIIESRLKRITAHRDKIGLFKTINDVLLMQGIDIDALDDFCKSIVKYAAVPKTRVINANVDLLAPPLDECVRTEIETCTGVWVRANMISWTQLDRKCNLIQWDCQSLEDDAIKNGLVGVVDSVSSIISKVPSSDVYTMESDAIIPFARMNDRSYYLHLHRQQVIAAIATILRSREIPFGGGRLINNVYMMHPRIPARLYNLLIGTENVSAESVVEKLINNQDKNDSTIIPVHADSHVKEYYKSFDNYQRELMNWSLLLTTAFMNLSVTKTVSLKKKAKRAGKMGY